MSWLDCVFVCLLVCWLDYVLFCSFPRLRVCLSVCVCGSFVWFFVLFLACLFDHTCGVGCLVVGVFMCLFVCLLA